MVDLDRAAVDEGVANALGLLRRMYKPSPIAGGGWYHRLDAGDPGPTATAVALTCFWESGADSGHWSDGLKFLVAMQTQSEDPLLRGGWPVTTSGGHPVLEATAWVSHFLGVTRSQLDADSPDTGGAGAWIIANQNPDGGWGSVQGTASRVYLTCLALRALLEIIPRHPCVKSGTDWLLNSRSAAGSGWGVSPNAAAPTITHTSAALATLAETRALDSDAERDYHWLATELDPTSLEDRRSVVETYNVQLPAAEGKRLMFASTLWHAALPWAISALIRHPAGPQYAILSEAVGTTLERQQDDGSWPNPWGSDGISIWAVAPFIRCLNDVRALGLTSGGQRTSMAVSGTLPARQVSAPTESAAKLDLLRLLLRRSRGDATRWVRKRWTSAVLLGIVFGAAVLAVVGVVSWEAGVLGAILPVILLTVQEARQRRSRRARNP